MSNYSEPFIRGGESRLAGSLPWSIQPRARFKKNEAYIGLRDRIHREKFVIVHANKNRRRARKIAYRVGEETILFRTTTRIESGVETFLHEDGTEVFSSAPVQRWKRSR